MILTLFISLYITFICWCYGRLTLLLFKTNVEEPISGLSFIITCFTGLAVIGTFFFFVSLIFPLGGIIAQLILIIPCLFSLPKIKVRNILIEIRGNQEFQFSTTAVFFISLLLILIMHSGTVNHPDTLNYHAQNIQLIEKYRAVPGIANLYLMYGLQSVWFILCALFSFKFTGTTALTFINVTVVVWFILFIILKISFFLRQGNSKRFYSVLWFILLLFSFWSYTQVRLFITSGSPDFIVVVYLWLAFYLFINMQEANSKYLLILFISFFTVTIKLQALPIAFFSLFYYYKSDKNNFYKKLLTSGLMGFIVFTPFIIRNIISSGYLLFPSDFPDFFNVDWKARKDFLVVTQQYITAYARANAPFSIDQNSPYYHMSFKEWLPVWWALRSLQDKIILLCIPGSLFSLTIFYKRIFIKQNRKVIGALLFLIAGIFFWFAKAPDPRFGFGFLIPFEGMIIYLILKPVEFRPLFIKKVMTSCLFLFGLGLLIYSVYRSYYFFTTRNIVQPAGISAVVYQKKRCNQILINFPINGNLCGDTPVPCLSIPCDSITQRGSFFEDGFRIIK